ncbi:MAG: CPBP family intramembrane metalloprotease [Micropruina sp.]|nr:MAG: CPBP family intramembrane metalloprotease [Micropruina sp.]
MVLMLLMTVPAQLVVLGLGAVGVQGRLVESLAHLLVFVTLLGIVWLVRTRWEGDPATYLALGGGAGRALTRLEVGIGVAIVLVGSQLALIALLGYADPNAPVLTGADLAVMALWTFTVSFLLQGLPEEILWRGYLQTTLMSRLSPITSAILTAVFFGSMHVVSFGSGGTWDSKLVYALTAMAMGLVMAGLRLVTGSTWAAIGYHAGWHLVSRTPALFGVQVAVPPPVWLQLLPGILELLAGVALLVWWRRTHRGSAAVPSSRS